MSRGTPPGKAKTRAKPHLCYPDPLVPGYRTCGLPTEHVSHDLPAVADDQAAAEARRLGERETG